MPAGLIACGAASCVLPGGLPNIASNRLSGAASRLAFQLGVADVGAWICSGCPSARSGPLRRLDHVGRPCLPRALTGNSVEEVSPISIGMVAAGTFGDRIRTCHRGRRRYGPAAGRRILLRGRHWRRAPACRAGSLRRESSSARRVAARMRNCRHSGCSTSDINAPRARSRRPASYRNAQPPGGLSASTRIVMARSTPPTGIILRIGSIDSA